MYIDDYYIMQEKISELSVNFKTAYVIRLKEVIDSKRFKKNRNTYQRYFSLIGLNILRYNEHLKQVEKINEKQTTQKHAT